MNLIMPRLASLFILVKAMIYLEYKIKKLNKNIHMLTQQAQKINEKLFLEEILHIENEEITKKYN